MSKLKKYLTLSSSLLLLGLATPVFAEGIPESPEYIQKSDWYVGLFGGVAFTPNTTLDDITTEYNVGWDAGGEIGYRYGPFRFELEYIFQRASIDRIDDFFTTGSVRVNAGMFNVLYDFGDSYAYFNPYLGAGVGYANIAQTFRSSDGEFAYQARGGVGFKIIENVVFSVEYRYFGTSTAPDALGSRFQNHMLNGGIVYYIDRIMSGSF